MLLKLPGVFFEQSREMGGIEEEEGFKVLIL